MTKYAFLHSAQQLNHIVGELTHWNQARNSSNILEHQSQSLALNHSARHRVLPRATPSNIHSLRQRVNGQNWQKTRETLKSISTNQIHRVHRPRTRKKTDRRVSLQNPASLKDKRRSKNCACIWGGHGHQTPTGQLEGFRIDQRSTRVLSA